MQQGSWLPLYYSKTQLFVRSWHCHRHEPHSIFYIFGHLLFSTNKKTTHDVPSLDPLKHVQQQVTLPNVVTSKQDRNMCSAEEKRWAKGRTRHTSERRGTKFVETLFQQAPTCVLAVGETWRYTMYFFCHVIMSAVICVCSSLELSCSQHTIVMWMCTGKGLNEKFSQ